MTATRRAVEHAPSFFSEQKETRRAKHMDRIATKESLKLFSSPSVTLGKAESENYLNQAVDLLRECESGFSAFVMGRRMNRKQRDNLRNRLRTFLDQMPTSTHKNAEATGPACDCDAKE